MAFSLAELLIALISLGVVLFVPVMLVLIYKNVRQNKNAEQRPSEKDPRSSGEPATDEAKR